MAQDVPIHGAAARKWDLSERRRKLSTSGKPGQRIGEDVLFRPNVYGLQARMKIRLMAGSRLLS